MPRIVDHDQRRAEIVEACWRTMATDGIEGATMRRIAEQAGCTTGRLTHYFASRQDILVAALGAVHQQAAERMAVAVADRTGLDAVRAVVAEALPLDERRATEWSVWLAFWGQAAVDPALRAEHERRYDEWRRLLRRLLRAALTPGGDGAPGTSGRRSPAAHAPGHDGDATTPVDVTFETERLIALVDGLAIQGIIGSASPRRITRIVDEHLRQLAERAGVPA